MDFQIKRKLEYGDVLVTIDDAAVGVSTPLENYLQMLVDEIGNPTTLLTKKALLERIKLASADVELKMKRQVAPYAHLVRR